MKKLLTLRNCLKAGALLLGLVAFFMMFTNQLWVELLGNRGYVEFDDALFHKDYGAGLSFVGYLLILLAALAVCALVFVNLDAKIKMYINLGLAFLLILGAIFVFVEAGIVNGKAGGNAYHLAFGPVFAGILAILAGLLVVGSEFIPDKQF